MMLEITEIPEQTSSKTSRRRRIKIENFSEVKGKIEEFCKDNNVDAVSYTIKGEAEYRVVIETLFG